MLDGEEPRVEEGVDARELYTNDVTVFTAIDAIFNALLKIHTIHKGRSFFHALVLFTSILHHIFKTGSELLFRIEAALTTICDEHSRFPWPASRSESRVSAVSCELCYGLFHW